MVAVIAAGMMPVGAHAGGPSPDGTDAAPAAGHDGPTVDWSGWFLGAQMGDAWGDSRWTASGPPPAPAAVSGSFSLSHRVDLFNQSGSFFGGFHAGYDRMLPGGLVLGGEATVSFATYPNLEGITLGGASGLTSPTAGAERYSDDLLDFGSFRGRIGYASGAWLLYATGGLAWAYDEFGLTQSDGEDPSRQAWRLGWQVGAGLDVALSPSWMANLAYSYYEYGWSDIRFAGTGQQFASDLLLREVHLGLSYRFGAGSAGGLAPELPFAAASELTFHGQVTFTYQGYPAFHSPYSGHDSLPSAAEAREILDTSLYAGARLWSGAQLWINPTLDQGFGVGNAHGVAGFVSAEAYKPGQDYPYVSLPRYFVRQTIDLGGARETLAAGADQLAGSETDDRLVLTAGEFAVTDIFDTNDYANDPRHDFLNWSLVNAGTFDYAADAWGFTDGLAAEWYQGRYTLRAGVFDLSTTPGGGHSPSAYALDDNFRQFQWVGEIEERHHLWGEPGDAKITGFLSRGRAGRFRDAIDLAAVTGQPADIDAVRRYTSRPGVSINLQQQITADLGAFARAGWADGSVEPWDFTDIDRTVSGGISLSGASWRRPQDTVGAAAVVNGITKVHQAFLNAGGLGVAVGDGKLPHPGLEKILETYYSFALLPSAALSLDYQLVDDPGYNTDRGPVNVFAVRAHWQF